MHSVELWNDFFKSWDSLTWFTSLSKNAEYCPSYKEIYVASECLSGGNGS